ncbi:MAG: RHS repeat protein [Acidobacteria bacterium]|nr:RHS repeat protein [Acidobacteriota bacterium]
MRELSGRFDPRGYFLAAGLLALFCAPWWGRASEVDSPTHGLRVEFWAETRWVAPGARGFYAPQPLVKHLKVTNTKPGGSRDLMIQVMRASQTTERFLNVTPPQTYGSDTGTTIGWAFSLGQDQSWEATFEEKLLPTTTVGDQIFNIASVSGTGIDGVLHFTPVSFVPFNRTTAANPGARTTDDPVNAAWGEMVHGPVTDIALPGPLPLAFQRYYASGLSAEGAVQSALGANWMHNFDLSLTKHSSSYVTIVYLGGKLIPFVKAMGVPGWSLNFHQEPVRYQFTQGNGFAGDLWMMDPDRERVFRFDNETGLLQEVYDRHDNRLTITRGDENRVVQVSSWLSGFGTRRTLTFTYTGGKLTQVSDGTRATTFTYNADGHLHSAVNPLGQAVTYTYAANPGQSPLLSQLTQPLGNSPFAQTFTPIGQVAGQRDAYDHLTEFDYDTPLPHQTRVTRPDASTLVFTHQDQRLGTAVQDPGGNTFTAGFNSREQRVSHQDRLGDTTAVTLHEPSGKIASYTDAEGRTTTYHYTARQQAFVNPGDAADYAVFTFYDLDCITYPDGSQASFTHDTQGNATSYTNAAGHTWACTYNAWGQPLTLTNPTGGVYTYLYDSNGQLASSRDSETGVTTYGHDALGRLNLITRPGGSTVSFTHDPLDRPLTVTNELNRTTAFTYDANGNLTGVSNPLGQTTSFRYDLMDRLDRITDPLGPLCTLGYDALGRPAAITNSQGHTTTLTYGATDQVTGLTNPAGQTLSFGYDPEGVLTSAATPLGATATGQSNKLGCHTEWNDPAGNTVHYQYDLNDRLTVFTDRLGKTTTFAYGPAGWLESVNQTGLGQVDCLRNPLGQVTQVTDLQGQDWVYGYSSVGRPLSKTDPLGRQQTYAYDNRGRLSQISHPGGMGNTAYTYDVAGGITRVDYPGGPVSTYAYDEAGRLVGAGDLVFSYDAAGNVTQCQEGGASFQAAYQNGLLLSVTYPGGADVTYVYDSCSRLAQVMDSRTNSWIDFTYDDDSRLTQCHRSNGVFTHYDYDGAGNLVRIQDGTIADQRYTLDAGGNPTATFCDVPLEPDPPCSQFILDHDNASQINNPGFVYDALGRQTAAPGRSCQYNGASQLTRVTADAITADFTYNGLHDLRTRTRMGEQTTYFHHYALGRAPIVAERTAAGYKRLYVYTPGGALLYSIDPETNGLRFYHYDRYGSTLFLTDGAGAVTEAYAYDPFGNPLGHSGEESGQPFTYLGQWGVRCEPVGGLYELEGGYYDPQTASFLQPKPGAGSLADPASLNPYLFAHQNPLAKAPGSNRRIMAGQIVMEGGRLGVVVEDTGEGLICEGIGAGQVGQVVSNGQGSFGVVVEDIGEGLICEGIGAGQVGQITTDDQGHCGRVVEDIGEGLIVEGLAAKTPSMSRRLSVIKELLPPIGMDPGFVRAPSQIPYSPWRPPEEPAPPASGSVARRPALDPGGNDDAAKLEVAARYVGASSAVRLATFKPSAATIAYSFYKYGGKGALTQLAGKSNLATAAVLSYIEVGIQAYTYLTEGSGAAAKEAGLIYSAVSWLVGDYFD